jgi:hypothetical protein
MSLDKLGSKYLLIFATLSLLIVVSACSPVVGQPQSVRILLRTEPSVESVTFWINSTAYFTNVTGLVQVELPIGDYAVSTEQQVEKGGSVLLNFTQWSTGDTSIRLLVHADKDLDLTAKFDVLYALSISWNPPPVSPTPGFFIGSEWLKAGTAASVTSPNVLSIVPDKSRSNLVSYTIDGLTVSIPSRKTNGTFEIRVNMNAPHSVTFNRVLQYRLVIDGGNNVTFNPASPTNDSWFDAGTSLSVSTDYVWDAVQSRSRKNLVAWGIDNNPSEAVGRVSRGRFVLPLTVESGMTLHLKSVNQFYLNVTGAQSITVNPVSSTDDGWYDEGTSISLYTDNVWNVISNVERMNLVGWTLDTTTTQVERANSGQCVVPPITMNTYHSLQFISVKQYHVSVQTDVSKVNVSGSRTNDSWFDEGSDCGVDAATPLLLSPRQRVIFKEWIAEGNSLLPIDASLPRTTILVTGPVNIKALGLSSGWSKSHTNPPISRSRLGIFGRMTTSRSVSR